MPVPTASSVLSVRTASAPPPPAAGPTLPVPSQDAPRSSPNAVAKPIDDPALPDRIPGFELRVLDLRKDVLFNVNGSWVKASVPVFFYYPTAAKDRVRALELLRQAYGDVLKLGQEPEWTAAELQRVIVNLDASLSLLEKN